MYPFMYPLSNFIQAVSPFKTTQHKPDHKTPKINALAAALCFAIPSLGLTLTASYSSSLSAADLLQTYELALKYDPEWSAHRSNYLSKRETEKIGLAGILPQVNFSARHANINYQVDGIDETQLTIGGIVTSPITDLIDCGVQSEVFADTTLTDSELDTFSSCINGSVDATDTSFTVTDASINVSQPLFRLDRWYGYKQSQAVADQAHAEYLKAQQELILRVADAYFNTLKAWEQVEFARREESSIQRQLRATQKRFQKGLVSSTDVYEAQAIFDLTRSSRITAEDVFRGAVEDIERLTRQPGIEITPLPDQLPIDNPQPNNIEAWVDAAKKNNLDLQAIRLASKVAQQNHKVKKSNHAPTVDLVASYTQSESNGRTSTLDQGTTETTSVGILFNVPLFTGGGTTAQERQAKYQMREAEYRAEQALSEVTGTTRKLFRSVVTSVHRIDALGVAISSNNKALEAVEKGYKLGTRNVAEVLQAQRDLYSARKDHANAKYDYILDTLRLKRVAGVLSDADLGNLNAWLTYKPSEEPPPATPINHSVHIDASSYEATDPRDAINRDRRQSTPARAAEPKPNRAIEMNTQPISEDRVPLEKKETFLDVLKGLF